MKNGEQGNVTIIAHTPQPEAVLQNAYSQCYQKPANIDTICRHLKHESVLEHVSYTFDAVVSRACLAQLTRHRLASYTVQSHRYTTAKLGDLLHVIPPSVAQEADLRLEWEKDMAKVYALYLKWLDKCRKEDARLFLPQSTTVRLTFTMNLREILHFCRLRLDVHAQWEIRELAKQVWSQVLKTLPNLAPALVRYIGYNWDGKKVE